jgi:hypothetical protein
MLIVLPLLALCSKRFGSPDCPLPNLDDLEFFIELLLRVESLEEGFIGIVVVILLPLFGMHDVLHLAAAVEGS